MGRYTIALTPVDKFFFGSDMFFGAEGRQDLNDKYKSYIIRSRMFPQQTSLLGMLRFLLLQNDPGCFAEGRIINFDHAERLIGPKSFHVNSSESISGSGNNFGAIKSLTACRIQMVKPNNQIVDLRFQPLYQKSAPVWNDTCKAFFNHLTIDVPTLDYSAKEGGIEMTLTDGTDTFTLEGGDNGIFKEERRIGINRDINSGLTQDSALFKQISYRFNNTTQHSFRFAFDAEIDGVEIMKYKGQMVSVGGDGSWFVLDIREQETPVSFNPPGDLLTLTLQSPSFIPKRALDHVKFAVTSLLPFCFMQSSVRGTTHYSILDRSYKRSPKKYSLYDTGSLFFFESADEKKSFETILIEQSDFRQIGYNEYK